MKTFPATLENLYRMMEYVKEDSLAKGFNEAEFERFEVAIEEALVNVIYHGYKESKGSITIICLTNPSQFHIIIEDNGIPHNPLNSKRTIDLDEPIETRQPGGYGVQFITEMMDDVCYERDGDRNRLILKKSRKAIPPS